MPGNAWEGVWGDVEPASADRRGLWARRVLTTALAIAVVLGLLGLLGVRTSTERASEGPWQVELTHASVARAGLDVPFELTLRHEGGFDGPVTIAVTGDYFDDYETQGFTPEPSASTRGAELLQLEFDPPPGDTLVVDYDAYIQPASQRGGSGRLGVVDGGRVVAEVHFDLRLLP